jgi:HPr kinase/phosphorylase
MEVIQASCVAIGYQGVLLTGPPGSGKSDLALRLIDAGGRLVADDLVALANERDILIARPAGAETRYGVLEVRGVGLLAVPNAPQITVSLMVQASNTPERLPEAAGITLQGIEIPLLQLSFLEASAPAKIRAALSFRRVA